MKIFIKCPDGFANQLRLALAADLLLKEKKIEFACQEWIINNHNIVDYKKFFEDLEFLKFEKIESKDFVKTQSFSLMIRDLCNSKNCVINKFKECFAKLKLKEKYKNLFNNFIFKNNIEDCIGLHLRTGCKTALLSEDKRRTQPLPHNAIISFLKTNNKKIYLATDNAETQDKFIDLFGERIMYFERINQGKEYFGPKYDIELVERFTNDSHVVADLFILQKCKYFIGSHESSFSIMIKYIRDNNLDYQIKGIL